MGNNEGMFPAKFVNVQPKTKTTGMCVCVCVCVYACVRACVRVYDVVVYGLMPGVSISDAATRKEESLSTALYDFRRTRSRTLLCGKSRIEVVLSLFELSCSVPIWLHLMASIRESYQL